jgi:CrcB protein
MLTVVAVAVGGALGSSARYGVAWWMREWLGPNAWGTFTVNVTGALVLGVIAGATAQRANFSPALRDGLTVGVLGGYTTFSSLMYEAVRQAESGLLLSASLNLAGSVAVGVAVMVLGLALGRALP